MDKIHLNFEELTEQTRFEIAGHLIDNYLVNHTIDDKFYEFKKDIKRLFDRNNAGIDIDVFSYMK